MNKNFKDGVDIAVNDPAAASRMINMLGQEVPKVMLLREIPVNGMEAHWRHPQEGPLTGVLIAKCHQDPRKLVSYNTGEYFSRERQRAYLWTMGNTGNQVRTKNGERITLYDDNKGCGAKTAGLPQNTEGLTISSIEKGQEYGITSTIYQHPEKCLYTIPAQYCELQDEWVTTPACDAFHDEIWEHRSEDEIVSKYTWTEVRVNGNSPEEDTWLTYDILGHGENIRKGFGGTGYGIFKFLSNRFWEQPSVPVRVQLYDSDGKTKTGATSKPARRLVRGLKHFMKDHKLQGEVPLKVQGMDVKAYWCVISTFNEPGYKSNLVATGKTCLAWKGETYFDWNRSLYKRRKDLNECGVSIDPQKVVVVFEISNDEKLQTNSARTYLYRNEKPLEMEDFYSSFLESFPEELREWQQEQFDKTREKDSQENINKRVDKAIQNFKGRFCTSSNKEAVIQVKGNGHDQVSSTGQRKLKSSSRIAKKYKAKYESTTQKLKRLKRPTLRYVQKAESEPLIKFSESTYELIVNETHNIFLMRQSGVADKIQGCLVNDDIKDTVSEHIFINTLLRIFEVNSVEESYDIKKEKWAPECLEGCWSFADEKIILDKVKALHKKISIIAA